MIRKYSIQLREIIENELHLACRQEGQDMPLDICNWRAKYIAHIRPLLDKIQELERAAAEKNNAL